MQEQAGNIFFDIKNHTSGFTCHRGILFAGTIKVTDTYFKSQHVVSRCWRRHVAHCVEVSAWASDWAARGLSSTSDTGYLSNSSHLFTMFSLAYI